MRTLLMWSLFTSVATAQLQITTGSVPVATQYQNYSTSLTATGGVPPYTWTVVQSPGVSLPEGMSLNAATGVVSAAQVNGQGGYAVTVQVTDSQTPVANVATSIVNFGVNSDTSLGGCQMFPADSIYNQRIDQLPVDTNASDQIPASVLGSPLHPDFGHGFYPLPGGIPWMRVPANQAAMNVNLAADGQTDAAGTYQWPFPAWPNALIEGTPYGNSGDHHLLVLQTGSCTLYETYYGGAVAGMYDATSNTWLMGAGAHYELGSNAIAASQDTLDNGAQDSDGIPIVPLLIRYSEVPLGVQHPLRMTFPTSDSYVWPATGCCGGSGPPEGLLYRLKGSVNWQATCPVSTNPQAATVLQGLQQYGAYMSDHGGAGYIQGVPDVRWDDNDLACIKQFHASDLEVVNNQMLEINAASGQTQPYVVGTSLPAGAVGVAYGATLAAVGGNATTRQWAVVGGTLPPGMTLNAATGALSGAPGAQSGSYYSFEVSATDTSSGLTSQPQTFSIAVGSGSVTAPDLTIQKTHTGQYAPGAVGDTYAITVNNNGRGATSGTVTVTEKPPAGMTLMSMAGTGWTCGAATCTRADALAPGGSYPVITVTANVAGNAATSVTNTATVGGGGETNTSNDTASVTVVALQITTGSVPVATQYQNYSTSLTATGGVPPYTWTVVQSPGVSLPEGMSLNAATGVVSAAQVNGQGGYAVTVQVTDSQTPVANVATSIVNFGVNSDTSLGGCQMFPADSIYNQRIDQLPVDTNASDQIPASVLGSPLHPDFGHGFYPLPGGIPWMRVPANQAAMNVNLAADGQTDAAGTYQWPFPAWPNALIEGTPYGNSGDHHLLVLQTGSCTLYETYYGGAVAGMYDATSNTWLMGAGAHYELGSNAIAASQDTLDNGAQDSDGIPLVPLLIRYSEVPLGVQHPLRMTFPTSDSYVWPATGCCGGSGPPEGLLYRLKGSVNWQATCPVSTNPQAATVLQGLQQYGAYMSDHGGAGYIQGVPDVRWDDNDLACIKQFHASDLEVVNNQVLEINAASGQTQPYVVGTSLPAGAVGVAYGATLAAVGGNATTRQWAVVGGTLPPGMTLNAATGALSGAPGTQSGSYYSFQVSATDTSSGLTSQPQTFSIAVGSGSVTAPDLTIQKTHTGQYAPGAIGDTYAITVNNNGKGATSGTVTVTEKPPAGMTVMSMAGTGWTCGAATCTRADALGPGGSYPVITVTANVAGNAAASVTNTATVGGGGETNTSNDTASVTVVALQITTGSVPVATQYQNYSTSLTATGGVPPYTWTVVQSPGVSLPEGMSLNAATGVVSAAQVNGQGGYAVTVQVTDSQTPVANVATSIVNFGVNSDTSLGGCQMFPADSIYNQRIDQLPVDTNASDQIPASVLGSPLHPDFGHGFYPLPGGIPWMRVPANQAAMNVNLAADGQTDAAGTYQWPFPAWPNALIEGTPYGNSGDHHLLVLQTGSCTLYETYYGGSVAGMYDATSNTWLMGAGAHYELGSNAIAASQDTLDNGAQDSDGIPIVPLLIRYSEVPLGVQHPLRMTFPTSDSYVWPATGCCGGSGPPEGLLYRLKGSVNWQATCPVSTNPQAATVLQGLQQYGAYMSDHGGAGYIQGVPDVRWDDNDLACIKQFHASDLEVVNNQVLEINAASGQTQPYVVGTSLPAGAVGVAYGATLAAVGGNATTRQWAVVGGTLPPGMTLNPATGALSGAPGAQSGSYYSFQVSATDTSSGLTSQPQTFSIAVGQSSNPPVSVVTLVNSASGAGGAIAPGELVTLKGANLGPPPPGLSFSTVPVTTNLGGTQVFFGSTPAAILYASATQINAIVPWEVAGTSTVNVQVHSTIGSSASLNVQVADAAPGIFTLNSSGIGPAVAFNPDGSLNGPANPVSAGSYLAIYFTGGGVTYPPGVDDSVPASAQNLTQSVTATVGGVAAVVLYAGAAPGAVNGVNQLNIQLAAGTPVGNAVPLVLTVGGQTSVATSTLSVQ
jgi:uncharacterized protein (TIGR03437 family)